MVAERVWRMGRGAGLGPGRSGAMRWTRGGVQAWRVLHRDGSAWDTPNGSHPRVKGQTLLGPDHFLSTSLLEMGQRNVDGASPSTTSAHRLCFQAGRSSSRSKRGGSVCPKAASEMNCLWEVPRLPFHSLNPCE